MRGLASLVNTLWVCCLVLMLEVPSWHPESSLTSMTLLLPFPEMFCNKTGLSSPFSWSMGFCHSTSKKKKGNIMISTGFSLYLKLTVCFTDCPLCIALPCTPFSFLLLILPLPLLEQVRLHTSVTPGLESCALKRLSANASSPNFAGCGFNLAARVRGVLQQHKSHLYLLHFLSAVCTLFCFYRNTASFSTMTVKDHAVCSSILQALLSFSCWDDQISGPVRVIVSPLPGQAGSSWCREN